MPDQTIPTWRDVSFTTRDGLHLHGRHYPAQGTHSTSRRPLVCFAGLTRNSRDFHDLALFLSRPGDSARDIFTLDSRGRGASDRDPDWRNYSVAVEVTDALDFITRLDLHAAAVLGTSRGGLVAMGIATARPTALGTVIFNDVGPVIDRNGLSRIMAYVGRTPIPNSWADAARLVRDMSFEQFPELTAADADALARQWFNSTAGMPVQGYDPAIARSLILPDGPLPELWRQFGAINHLPALVLRGGNSDLLSASTVEEMIRRHPNLAAYTVPNEGHAPLLRDAASQTVIRDFLAHTDRH